MRNKLFAFNTGITLLVMSISSPILLITFAFLMSQPSANHLRKYIYAQESIAHRVFPSTNSLMHFINANYQGRQYYEADLNIYKVDVYGHIDCAQLIEHHPFANPAYDSIRLFNCNGNALSKTTAP